MPNEYEQPVEPMSRTEDLLRTGTEEPVIAMSEIEKILRGEHIDRPHSRVADLLLQYNPSDILIEKSITENGTYYARIDNADGYYKVVVDTPVVPPTVLEHLVETISTNGTHTFTPGTGVDGYSDATITVDVPSDPDPGIYMYYWDLTKSLTDLIRGAQATLSTSGAEFIEGTGIVISSTGYVKTAVVTAINFWGKTIEYHIKYMSKNFGDTCRLLTYLNNHAGGLIFKTDHWQIRNGETWMNYTQTSSNEILEDGVLKLVFDSDRNNVKIYINDTKIYEGAGWHTSASTLTLGLPSVGSVGNGYYTSYNMNVTSIRVYENGSGGKGTTELNVTQNGTYTAPTGSAYSEVNVNVSQTPHLAARTIQNNGLFRSDVDGLDGYNNVVVNVADNTPNYEQLTVTQNGVYTPSSSSVITFGLADGIPEEVETEVPAGGSVTRKDNLTINCYDKVSQVGVTATINTSSIANKATPQSLREKTLIICEDADHYVYLTKTNNSLWIIQKGYTFNGQSFELEDNASAYNMVTVNLPDGTNTEY